MPMLTRGQWFATRNTLVRSSFGWHCNILCKWTEFPTNTRRKSRKIIYRPHSFMCHHTISHEQSPGSKCSSCSYGFGLLFYIDPSLKITSWLQSRKNAKWCNILQMAVATSGLTYVSIWLTHIYLSFHAPCILKAWLLTSLMPLANMIWSSDDIGSCLTNLISHFLQANWFLIVPFPWNLHQPQKCFLGNHESTTYDPLYDLYTTTQNSEILQQNMKKFPWTK